MLKFLTELGPLIAFFIGYKIDGIISATIYMLIASCICMIITYIIEKKINKVTLISMVLLMISSSLTIYSGNPIFIKMKPTLLYSVFAFIFFITMFKGTLAIKYILGNSIMLKEEKNWRKLNIRFMFFFLFMAVLNEFVWRNFDENIWVNFKVFGAAPLTIIFVLAQLPFIMKNKKSDQII